MNAPRDAADRAFSEYLRHYVGLQDASKMRFTQEELHGFYRAAWKTRTNQVAELVEVVSAYLAWGERAPPAAFQEAFPQFAERGVDAIDERARALIASHKGEQP